jgi:leucyl aminopeptidase (aminopeptidase T)
VISISGEIHNANNANEPLIELPLIEELAVAIRKRKAFPVLEMSTEKLKKRFFAEMPDEVFSVPPNYYKNWINAIDKFIEISWESYSSDFHDKSDRQLKQFKDSTNSILQHLFQQKKKIIFLNFPTQELAEYIGTEYKKLVSTYIDGVNCNYNLLKINGEEYREQYFSFSNYRITTNSETLAIKINRDKPVLFSGDISEHQVLVLPTGIIEFPINRESMNGIYFAEKIYYKDRNYNNIKIKFENGSIRYVAFKEDIKEYTNYFSYDRCIDGNISMKFFDKNSKPIFLSNINSKIDKETKIHN